MGKYAQKRFEPEKPKENQPHAVWRGVGCVMMLIVPAISIALAIALFDYGLVNGWPIPYEFTGYLTLPSFVYYSAGLTTILYPLTQINNLPGYIFFSIALTFLLGILISGIYAILYSMFGPKRFTGYNVPPPNVKVKKYKR